MSHSLSSVPALGLRAPNPPVTPVPAAEDRTVGREEKAISGRQVGGTESVGLASRGPATRVEISPAAQKAASAPEKAENPDELSEEEERQVQKLRQRDTEVRAHEQAHSAAGGGLAGAASYEFVTGPDGKRYAVGGEVQIDTSAVRDNPAATIAKMDVVIRAALAPADPSAQDQAVARDAAKLRSEAQAQLQQQAEAERENGDTSAQSRSKPDTAGAASSSAESRPQKAEDDDTSSTSTALQSAINAYSEQAAFTKDAASELYGAAAQLETVL